MSIKQFFWILIIMLNPALSHAVEIIKSPTDQRDYKYFELDNKLKVVVVSDPQVDKSAASLDVAVGSGTDPVEWPGMAHFLEHMLFLGTEKYPQSGEYQAFIQQHGGSSNAFTAYDHTNYFYDIDPEFLYQSLDRFAQFFISPVLNAELVDRERNAVHSEYFARRTDEFRRSWSARKQVFNPEHPITQFSIGNNETLADKPEQTVRQALLEFHQKYYSANIMTLSIVGKQSVEELESWVKELFSAIPNHDIEPFAAAVPIYAEDSLPKLLEVNSLKKRHNVSLSFSLPQTRSHYKTKPLQYLSHLLGHEGEGSLLSYLKSQDWVETLSSGIELNNPEGSSFSVSIRATEQGFANWQAMVNSVLAYIDLVRDSGIESWRYQELDEIAKVNFDFLPKNESDDFAVFLSSSMQEYPAAELLTASYLMSDYDADLIENFAEQLNVNNLLVTLSSPEFDSEQQTNYFNTPFQVSELPKDIGRDLNVKDYAFGLPKGNPFVPEATALKHLDEPMAMPQLLVDEAHFKYFYQNDLEFDAPRASTYVSVRSKIAGKSAHGEVIAQLYTRMIKEQLNEEFYPATLVGLSFEFYSHLRGITIRISGYDDKQSVLLTRVLDELSAELNPAVFELKKNELIDKFENEKHEAPYQRLYDQANDLLVENSWPNSLLLQELKAITLDQVKTFQTDFFKSIEVVGLSHGNLTQDDAKEMAELLREKLVDVYELGTVNRSKVVQLPQQKKFLSAMNLEHQDAAVAIFKQAKGEAVADRASMYMLYQLMEAPFFHQLRTVEQLGYIVYASPYLSLNVPYVTMVVESPNTSAAHIIERMNAFLADFKTQLAELSEAEFNQAKQGLLIKTNKKDDALEDRSNRYWTEIDRENYQFDSRKKLSAAIENLTLAQVQAAYDEVFFKPGFGEFVSIAPGKLEFDQDSEALKSFAIIEDSIQFKQDAQYFD